MNKIQNVPRANLTYNAIKKIIVSYKTTINLSQLLLYSSSGPFVICVSYCILLLCDPLLPLSLDPFTFNTPSLLEATI